LISEGGPGSKEAASVDWHREPSGILYYYFESREELIRQIMTRGITETHAHVNGAVEQLPPEASSQGHLAELIKKVRADGYLLPHADSRVLRLPMVGAVDRTSAWCDATGSASVEQIAELLVQMRLSDLAWPGLDGPS